MNQKSKCLLGLGCLGLALASMPAQAQLQLLNGDFSLNTTQGNAPVDWYVPTTSTGGSWWISTWVGPNVSPTGSSVLGLSFMTSTNWAYQNIGTDNNGSPSLTLNFDLGSFTDAGAARNLGVTVALYQSASFTAANGTDVNGASGVTLLGSQSVASGLISAGAVVHETLSFDLTGANATDPLYLRFINYQVDTTQPWAAIDNVTVLLTPEPSTLALGALGGVAFLVGRRVRR